MVEKENMPPFAVREARLSLNQEMRKGITAASKTLAVDATSPCSNLANELNAFHFPHPASLDGELPSAPFSGKRLDFESSPQPSRSESERLLNQNANIKPTRKPSAKRQILFADNVPATRRRSIEHGVLVSEFFSTNENRPSPVHEDADEDQREDLQEASRSKSKSAGSWRRSESDLTSLLPLHPPNTLGRASASMCMDKNALFIMGCPVSEEDEGGLPGVMRHMESSPLDQRAARSDLLQPCKPLPPLLRTQSVAVQGDGKPRHLHPHLPVQGRRDEIGELCVNFLLAERDSSGRLGSPLVLDLNRSSDPRAAQDVAHNLKLPLVPGTFTNFVSSDVVAALLQGKLAKEGLDHYLIIDARYGYEYEGGHIRGALNLNIKRHFRKLFETNKEKDMSRVAIIIHCEFSQQRGPKCFRYLRQLDRAYNLDRGYHQFLSFPELYVMEGGYKSFFPLHRPFCVPEAYVSMFDPAFSADLRLESVYNQSQWDSPSKGRRKGTRKCIAGASPLLAPSPAPEGGEGTKEGGGGGPATKHKAPQRSLQVSFSSVLSFDSPQAEGRPSSESGLPLQRGLLLDSPDTALSAADGAACALSRGAVSSIPAAVLFAAAQGGHRAEQQEPRAKSLPCLMGIRPPKLDLEESSALRESSPPRRATSANFDCFYNLPRPKLSPPSSPSSNTRSTLSTAFSASPPLSPTLRRSMSESASSSSLSNCVTDN